MPRILLPAAVLSALLTTTLTSTLAAPVAYTVAPLDQLNVVNAESETDVENFNATTSKISGTVSFDPAAKTGSATLSVDGASLKTGMAARDGHMRGGNWFNFDAAPAITFKTTRITYLSGDNYRVAGNLTMNGVTKPVSTTARVKLTPASEVTKTMGLSGDALAVSLTFDVTLSAFNVTNPAIKAGRVADKLPISIKLIASNAK